MARDPTEIPGLLPPFQPTATLREIEKERNSKEALVARIVGIRTEYFTDATVAGMDTDNLRRLAQLSPMAQELVVRFYCENGPVRKPQAFMGTTIRGIRDMLEQGLPYTEVVRFMQRADTQRLSYRPCYEYGATGRCRDNDECNHLHIMGVTVHPRDYQKGNYTPKGMSKGKGKDLTDSDRAFLRSWY